MFINIYAPTNGAERVFIFNNLNKTVQKRNPENYLVLGVILTAQRSMHYIAIMQNLTLLQVMLYAL